MGQVIPISTPPLPAWQYYLYGETLLCAAKKANRLPLLDEAGKPVRPGELYEVTPTTIRRIA